MDTRTDITLVKVDKYGRPLEKSKDYSLKRFLDDIKSGKAELRFKVGISEEGENGEVKWITPNHIWIIYTDRQYRRRYGWFSEVTYYRGSTNRNYKEINELFGYHIIDTLNTYL